MALSPPPPPGRSGKSGKLDDEPTHPGLGGNETSSEQEERTDPAIRVPPHPPRALSFGKLSPLMQDDEITEVMINDLRNVMIEREGRNFPAPFHFTSPEELAELARAIALSTGQELSAAKPYLDGTLPDGSRVNVVAPPLVLRGPCITIRKFPKRPFQLQDLAARGMLDARIAAFLEACVRARLNILLSGGTGSGKTTLLNALTRFIPETDRLITIEDTRELTLAHANSVQMVTKAPSPGIPAITARELVATALRMRPDRIIVGECRRHEAFDMLMAMNTGHDGSMTTLHSNSPRDALTRLETLCMLAGTEMPLVAIRKQVQSAVDLVVQVQRYRDGVRRIVSISELSGMEGDVITMSDIFACDPGARAFKSTGYVPSFMPRLTSGGHPLPVNFFA